MTQYKKNPNRIGALWSNRYTGEKGETKIYLKGSVEIEPREATCQHCNKLTLTPASAIDIKIYKNDFKNSDRQPDFKIYKHIKKDQAPQVSPPQVSLPELPPEETDVSFDF